jgi:pimeloyl-ACP methyl ester carboxylesterase
MKDGLINIDGKAIYYEFINSDLLNNLNPEPLLIFLHHGVGSVRQWADFPLLLSSSLKYPALLYDRYGYGRSEALSTSREADYLNHEGLVVLPELIDRLNIKNKLILIGHSDGGSIALIYASLAPDNFSGIITEAPHVFVDDYSRSGVKKTVVDFESGRLKRGLRKYHEDKVESMFYGWADIWLSEKFRTWNIEEMLNKIEVPVLVIQGDKDEYGTISQVEATQTPFKERATVSIINNCGHSPHSEYKNDILGLMRNFILNLRNK